MFRRSLTIVLAFACLLVLAPAAFAARVVIRVEGKTQTIFAPVPRVVEASNALDALEAASVAGEFYYHVKLFSFGSFVDQIGRYAGSGSDGWSFKVNGASPSVGADQVTLKDADSVLWYYATFGPNGGPQTLKLVKTPLRAHRAGCYEVTAFDDAGKVSLAGSATLHVDGRRIRTTRQGLACPGPHRGLVRATAPGMIRSNAVR